MAQTPIRTLSYILRRLLETIPLLIGVVAISFTLIHTAPGDPAALLAGEFAEPAAIEKLRVEFGLDQPIYVQFFTYLQKVFTGDLGFSYRYRSPVLDLILSRVPATLLLLLIAFTMSLLIGIVLAVFTARRPNSAFDNTVSGVAMIGYCLPMFWSGMMLILLFSAVLEWLPTGGMYSLKADHSGFGAIYDVARHAVLPAITYTAYFMAISFRLTRSKMIETMREDFIRTARAKGLTENEVLFRHALRNSLVPVVAVMGLNFGVMVGGSVTVETVFSWPGVGRLMYDSILSRDYPLLLGMFVIVSIGIILANLIGDLITAAIDPRIVYE
jgi:peptide/nickel transport system permease protein